MECDRPKCRKTVSGDNLYCSEECFNADNDALPIYLPNRWGGQGSWNPTPVILPE